MRWLASSLVSQDASSLWKTGRSPQTSPYQVTICSMRSVVKVVWLSLAPGPWPLAPDTSTRRQPETDGQAPWSSSGTPAGHDVGRLIFGDVRAGLSGEDLVRHHVDERELLIDDGCFRPGRGSARARR
jgi:hypothetical protein